MVASSAMKPDVHDVHDVFHIHIRLQNMLQKSYRCCLMRAYASYGHKANGNEKECCTIILSTTD